MTKRAKRVPYSRERRAECLALARIAGAEVASDQTHIPVQTVRRWMDAAGIQPGADLPQERLEAMRDLAEATVTADLVAGRIRGVQAMTVAGIARRHIHDAKRDDEQSAVTAREAFTDWLVDTVRPGLDAQEVTAAVEAIEALTPELLRRANAELGQSHRQAMLAWFSGRLEIPADGVMEWAREQTQAILTEHGTLSAWLAYHRAEVAAQEAELPPPAQIVNENRLTSDG